MSNINATSSSAVNPTWADLPDTPFKADVLKLLAIKGRTDAICAEAAAIRAKHNQA